MNNKSKVFDNDKLILVLDESKFEVNTTKLVEKSQYFAALLTHNFRDSKKYEHIINYDVSVSTLSSFIEWIECDSEHDFDGSNVKSPLLKYQNGNVSELKSLLQLSVIFGVDDLIEELIITILYHWLVPSEVIGIWTFAKELSLKTLQDACMICCLDRYQELPLDSLIGLSQSNILEITNNVNLNSNKEWIIHVLNNWILKNKWDDIINKTIINLETNILKYKSTVIPCVVGFKMVELSWESYVYFWDSDKFSELLKLRDIKKSKDGLIGGQVLARGFSIYVVGGEYGLGTGKFNMKIWRYCLVTKRWLYETLLPAPRRHMVASFIENKLFLVGGVGRYRQKLSSVDIYNIHSKCWLKGTETPMTFTEVPPHCVVEDNLVIRKDGLHIYDKSGCWKTIEKTMEFHVIPFIESITYHKNLLFWYLDDKLYTVNLSQGYPMELILPERSVPKFSQSSLLSDGDFLWNFICIEDDDYILVEKGMYDSNSKCFTAHDACMINDTLDFRLALNYGSFKVIDPNTLYKQIN